MNLVDLTTLTVGGIGLPVLVMFFTQAIKGVVPDKLHTVLPYIVGVVFALFALGFQPINALVGVALGLIATGEYRIVNPSEE
jgi:hypothetical protein